MGEKKDNFYCWFHPMGLKPRPFLSLLMDNTLASVTLQLHVDDRFIQHLDV